jgi:FMN phosphatase YigB (HAD superfamily)
MKKLVIFDFDGTLTDAEKEGTPFKEGYFEDLATLTGFALADLKTQALEIEKEIAQNSQHYGWLFQGKIVAPATVDPYLRMMPVARKLLDQAQVLMNNQDRERVLDGILYKYNYQKTNYAFRNSTLGCLQRLLSESIGESVYIVTNSHTDAVQNKIKYLENQRLEGKVEDTNQISILPFVDRVYGRARKYMIDDSFDTVPLSLQLPHLSRPVLLRRKHYFDVLDQLRQKAGANWSDVFVCGDIFELDLSLPIALGASVGLVQNPFTPQWEIDYLEAHPRGYLIKDLHDIFPILES